MSSELLHGFEADFKMLLDRFEEGDSLRFVNFAVYWRDMNFSLVFLGNGLKEDICFTIEVLSVIKSYFIQTDSLIRKVGALYTLYGFYYKQPVVDSAKILVTLPEWIEVKRFIAELQETNHYDAVYIILKLVFSNAFSFSLLTQKQLTIVPHSEIDSMLLDYPPVLDTLEIDELFEELTDLETEYEAAKRVFTESVNIPPINYCEKSISSVLQTKLYATEVKEYAICHEDSRQLFREAIYRKKVTSNLYKSVIFQKSSESESD